MIAYIKGTILSSLENPIIIKTQDIGYAVYVPETLRSSLRTGDDAELHIHSYIKEDAFDLYGFISKEDLMLFKLLIQVSGIGPKTALGVLDKGAKNIQHAVMHADIDFFTGVPRLGKKNAQKLIIELKTKLGSLDELDLSDEHKEQIDVIEALVQMGFDRRSVVGTIREVSRELPIEKQIKIALQKLSKK